MMEEVSDDTNGESSFEFVSGKIDENNSQDDNAPPAAPISTTSPGSVSSQYPVLPQSVPPTYPVASQNTESNVKFYDINPNSSQSVVLPPLAAPGPSSQMPSFTSGFQNFPAQPGPPMLASPPAQAPPPIQAAPSVVKPEYFTPLPEHSALNLPLDRLSAMPEQQSEPGVWGWFKGKSFLNKVAEKAKNSVDSVITTLDPGMKEIINTGGDINVIVASGNADKISSVREAFQEVFGKATVQGCPVQASSIAPQPVGFSAGLKAAEERINNLKQLGHAQDKQILVAIENFLAELTPDNWFDMGCILLQDQSQGINLQVYTEAIPVSSQFVNMAKKQTPPDYPLGWSGYAVTIGHVMEKEFGVPHSSWHEALTLVSRREILYVAAKTIAGLYKTGQR